MISRRYKFAYWICHATSIEICRLLSDVTKSGRLFFPQFVLAFYLCRLKLMRRKLPLTLSKPIIREVLRVVNTISSGIQDNRSRPLPLSSASISDSSIGSGLTPSIPQPFEDTRCGAPPGLNFLVAALALEKLCLRSFYGYIHS